MVPKNQVEEAMISSRIFTHTHTQIKLDAET